MYYIETIADDAFHAWIASMTGAALFGRAVDEGVYKFVDEKSCNRAVRTINQLYGRGIFTVVMLREEGVESIETPKEEPKKEKPTKVKEEDPMLRLVQDKVAEIEPVKKSELSMSEIVKTMTKPYNQIAEVDNQIAEVDYEMESIQNMMAAQYELDETGLYE